MTEKESLLVLNQEIKSDLSFCRDCAISQGATGWVKDFDRLLDKNEILNNKLNQQFSSRSKLSIPKQIAEIVDETWGYGDIDPLDIFGDVRLPDFEKWWKSQDHPKDLIVAYLAGEALGVELVEIEG
jgi:hypothetical protein